MKEYEIAIIGGGSAGIAAAISAYENGCRDILIIERDKELGGILLQCIHNGFGLHMFNEELSGPAYAERFIDMLKDKNINVKLNSMVTHISPEKEIQYVNSKEGYVSIKAKAIILAMGCRERTRGAIGIGGYRPSGILTAGTAQRYLNLDGYLAGKKIFILGSGDIGLIMARRMTLEGAKVLGVAEIMPYSNGLPRNMKQCLDDFNIPIYLSHTVSKINGKDRVSSIEIIQVDENLKPIKGTEKSFDVDTLLLSVGLIPENALSQEANVELSYKTKGPVVSESLQTNIEGIFACGNVLHVHDLVDFVSNEGKKAGYFAAKYIKKQLRNEIDFETKAGDGIGYVLPQRVNINNIEDKAEFMFRVTNDFRNVEIQLAQGDNIIKKIKKPHLVPAEMESILIDKKLLMNIKDVLEFKICRQK